MRGTEKLGNTLLEQMQGVNQFHNRTPSVQLGTIKSGRELKLDTVSYSIPPSDYMVSRSALLVSNAFNPGDRVLVAIVGTEPIVIDIVVPADAGAFGG